MADKSGKKNKLVIRLKEQNKHGGESSRKRAYDTPLPGEPIVKSKVVDCRRPQDDVLAQSMNMAGIGVASHLAQENMPPLLRPISPDNPEGDGNNVHYNVVDEFVPDYNEDHSDSEGEITEAEEQPPKLDCFPKEKDSTHQPKDRGDWRPLKKQASCQTETVPKPQLVDASTCIEMVARQNAATSAKISTRDVGTSVEPGDLVGEQHDLGSYFSKHKKTGSNSLKGSKIGTFTLIQKCAVFRGADGNQGKIIPMEWLAGFDEMGEPGEFRAQGLGFEVRFNPAEEVMPCSIKETSG